MALPVLVQVGGSAAVVAFMVAVAALLGFRQSARIDAAALERLAREADPDAKVEATFTAPNGAAGLARLADGRVLTARVVGEDTSVRLTPARSLHVRLTRKRLTVTFGDFGFPPLHIALKNTAPPDWIVRLAGDQGEKT
ncbi:MAG TPA: hypothetical protein VG943_07080 [Caulobacterales bacterium]|nr:hypothetical protein [Caulobacterales bacterium]